MYVLFAGDIARRVDFQQKGLFEALLLLLILLGDKTWISSAVFEQGCVLWCIFVYLCLQRGLGICRWFDPPQRWMSIRDESRDNSQMQRKEKKTQKHVTIKQSPVLHTGFPQLSLWGQKFSGDTVALLIRSEAKLLNHIHTVDGQSRFLLLQFMFQPRSVSDTQPSTLSPLKELQRQSEEGRTIPARKNLSLNAAKMIFFFF